MERITRLQDKCTTCGKIAKVKSSVEVKTSFGRKKVITLECLHVIFQDCDSQSDFENFTFDGSPDCKHVWNKTVCLKCNAKKLFPYQIEGARSLEKANGRLGIFDEMGLGKTIQALAYLKFNESAFPYLWVTKSGIKYQHAKEIVRLLGKEYFPQVIMTGRDTLIPNMKGYLASYDMFRNLKSLDMFREAGIKTLVLDECQAIKNSDSSRTACIRVIAKDVPNIIPLSGTFWKNRGSEAFVTLNLLDPKRFYSYETFKKTKVSYYWQGNKEKEGGLLPGFMKEISDIAIRRERKDVMPELPLISRTKLLTEVPEHARSVYKEEEDKLIASWNDAVIGGEEDSFDTQRKIMESLIIMRQIVGLAKVNSTVEFAKEFLEETDRKLVIFVHHKKCGELIANQLTEYCKAEQITLPLVLNAELNSIERIHVQDKFNSSSYRLMIASTLASGEGLNLQTCSDCIMHERQWNPANEEQAEGRFIRIGQLANTVNATYVHGDDTVDTILDGIVENKRIHFHNSMNSGELITWNESNIITDLARAISDRRKK